MRVTNIERATVPLRDAAKKTIDDAVMAGALSMSAGQQLPTRSTCCSMPMRRS